MIIVFEIVDDRAAIQIPEKQSGTKTTMPDNQIRLDAPMRLERLKNRVAMPDTVFECPTALVRTGSSRALGFVLDAADSPDGGRGQFRDKRTLKPVVLDQILRDMPELGRKIFMNKKDMHTKSIRRSRAGFSQVLD